MKKITILIALLCCLFGATHANHLLGGEINYRYVSSSGNSQTYRVTLSFFADCQSNTTSSAFQALVGADPLIKLYKGGVQVNSQRLVYDVSQSDVEITPVCADEAGNTTCSNVNNPIPGIRKYVYSGDFTLTDTFNNWRFTFEGEIGNNSSAGRSAIIQNAFAADPLSSPPSATILFLEATLNNTIGTNNSTIFTSLPTPFFCLNKASTYSLGAADAEVDDLIFSLIPAKSMSDVNMPPVVDITYTGSFNGQAPLPTAAGNFIFNIANGQMNFTPNQVMNCVVTNLVEEFRNGVRVGSSMREMTFVILDNCNNDAPLSPISNIQNAESNIDSSGNLNLTVCEGQVTDIAFDIESTDPNGDNTTVTYSNLPPGAAVTVDNNGTDSPKVHFVWNVIDAAPGNYIFYITYTDDGCPLVTTKTIAYTIRIIPHINKFVGGSSPSCESTSTGQAWAHPAASLPITYSYRWVDAAGNTLQEFSSTTGDTLKNIPAGKYKVYIRNDGGCGTNVEVEVTENPAPSVTLRSDTTLCEGMPIALSVDIQNGVNYLWSTGDTTCCITAVQAGNYVITASNNCGDVRDDVNITNVKCNFCLFVPNAFSPNNDGNNDVFRILETCLMQDYKLQIFNRWGQLVFTSLTTAKSWDGRYKGGDAETGTYFYQIRATPVDKTKGTVELKGDIALIR